MNRIMTKLEEVSFSYFSDNRHVLKTLSLDIPGREITALLGPNGVGKTTLLYLILGWIEADGGTISHKGRLLHRYSRREMGQLLGLVPQSEHIAFEYSVLEYVLLGRAPYLSALQTPSRRDYEKAEKALDRVGMGGSRGKAVTHLSGGEKQLVLLARSLAQEPEILLLDEPMSNLDLSNKSRMISILRSLKEEGTTVLLTSHEPEVAAALSDNLILMGADHYVEQGPTDLVLTAENLSRIYGIPVHIHLLEERKIIVWD